MCEKESPAINMTDVLSRHPRHPSLIHIKKYNVKERKKLFEKLQENPSMQAGNLNEREVNVRMLNSNCSVAHRKELNNLREDESLYSVDTACFLTQTSDLPSNKSSSDLKEKITETCKSDYSNSTVVSPPVPVFTGRFTSQMRPKNTVTSRKPEKYAYVSNQPFKSTLISKVVWTGIPETPLEKSDESESGVFLNELDCTSDENSSSPSKPEQKHSALTKSTSSDAPHREHQQSIYAKRESKNSGRKSAIPSLAESTKPFLPPKPPRLLNQISCSPVEHRTIRSTRSYNSPSYEFLTNTHSINPHYDASTLSFQKCSTFPTRPPADDKFHADNKLAQYQQSIDSFSSIPQDIFLCRVAGVAEMKDKFERQSFNSELSSSVGMQQAVIRTSADDPDSKGMFKMNKSKKFISKRMMNNPSYEYIKVDNAASFSKEKSTSSKVLVRDRRDQSNKVVSQGSLSSRSTDVVVVPTDQQNFRPPKKFASIHDEQWRKEMQVNGERGGGGEPTYAEPLFALNERFVSQSNVAFDSEGYAIPCHEISPHFIEQEDLEADKSVYMRGLSKEERSYFKSKVSDAYSILRRGDNLADGISSMAVSEYEGVTQHKEIESQQLDFLEHEKRLNYVSTIRRLTFKNVSKYEQVKCKNNINLFEYALVVGLKPQSSEDEADANDDCCDHLSSPDSSKSNVLFSWPKNLQESDLMTSNFCFPDASRWKTSSQLSGEMFCFFLTTSTGDRKFCWCLRYLPEDSDLPEAVCVVSMIGEAGFYQQLLNSVKEARMHSLQLAQETLKSAYLLKLPRPNKELYIIAKDLDGFKYTGVLRRATESHYSTARFGTLVRCLPVALLIQVLASILLERRVILLAEQLSTLSSCIMSISTLLYPFTWLHTLITVLPPSLIELIHSPTPYVLGMFSSYKKFLDNSALDEVLIVDLDEGKFVKSLGDESTILPKKIQKALTLVLTDVTEDHSVTSSGITDVTLTEAFLRMFVEMCGHYKDYIAFSLGTGNTFQGEEFVKAASSSSIRYFLEWFSSTQMFQVFIHDRMKESFVPDLFDQRIKEYKKELESATNLANMKLIRSKFFNFFKSYGTKIKKSLKKPPLQ